MKPASFPSPEALACLATMQLVRVLYYLLSSRPESGDTRFDWTSFMYKNNSELLANLGNFVNRLTKFTIKHFDGRVPDYRSGNNDESFASLSKDVNELLAKYLDNMEGVRLRAGLDVAMAITARDRVASVVGYGLNLVYLLSALFYPFMPAISADIACQLNAPLRAIPERWTGEDLLPGHSIREPKHLFRKIDEKKMEEWRGRFGGADTQGGEKKAVVVVANLKPVTMRGVKSAAMLLAEIDDPTIELFDPPKDAEVGEKLNFEG
ncbi:hypothetical protein HYE68_008834 [Fusarium pseudograminearum]|nr:hypothetical protein HYE68_008834 [Fusarium pseudograminearum]